MTQPVIVGRSSSHFTRLVLIVAEELGIDYGFFPVRNLMSLDTNDFGGHPGLRIPTLKIPDGEIFGAVNICHRLAVMASREKQIVWPAPLNSPRLLKNFDELTMQSMASQVTLVLASRVAKIDPANLFSEKLAKGLGGMLAWLDQNLEKYRAQLPANRLLSITEVALFCLFEHIKFLDTIPLVNCRNLETFANTFADRPSSMETTYDFGAI